MFCVLLKKFRSAMSRYVMVWYVTLCDGMIRCVKLCDALFCFCFGMASYVMVCYVRLWYGMVWYGMLG